MKKLNVLFLSIFDGNHYKTLLVENLNNKNVQVEDYFPTVFFLPRVIKEGKPDILHLHTIHYFFLGKNQINRTIKFFLFIIQAFFLKLIGTKIVWTVHEWSDRFDDGKNDIYPVWAAILGKLFSAVITHCETTKNEIVKAFRLENKNKVFVVPHGNYIGSYDNKVNQVEARKYLDIPQENLVFLLFGNLHRTKGFLEAIDAFKGLDASKISLLIVGNPAEEKIEELITDKIQDHKNILFIPRKVPDEEIQIYMNACDCVIVPYKVFTTSGVTLLTMSFGKACIAPNLGFFSDVLNESGSFLYDSTHEDSLLQAMKQAIERREQLLDMGKHNLQIAEQWSWEFVANKTLKIYQDCLNN